MNDIHSYIRTFKEDEKDNDDDYYCNIYNNDRYVNDDQGDNYIDSNDNDINNETRMKEKKRQSNYIHTTAFNSIQSKFSNNEDNSTSDPI